MVYGKRIMVDAFKELRMENGEWRIKKKLFSVIAFVILSCGGEWGGGTVGKTSCTFNEFNKISNPVKMSYWEGDLYILDYYSTVHSYRRDDLYECAFDIVEEEKLDGFPDDVFASDYGFHVKDREYLDDCRVKDGVFAVYGNELAVGSSSGVETWSINNCARTGTISSFNTLALATHNGKYFVVEGVTEPLHLSVYPGNEPKQPLLNFCSADRLVYNNHGIYLLDKKCNQIGVFDNLGVWQKNIDLDSVGIRNPIDIAPAEYQHFFVLHKNGMERL